MKWLQTIVKRMSNEHWISSARIIQFIISQNHEKSLIEVLLTHQIKILKITRNTAPAYLFAKYLSSYIKTFSPSPTKIFLIWLPKLTSIKQSSVKKQPWESCSVLLPDSTYNKITAKGWKQLSKSNWTNLVDL